MSIPVIDIFAGPGGLGEGFTSIYGDDGDRVFKTVLSIEMEKYAHETLELRTFYRQFPKNKVPVEYYQFLRGEITKEKLFSEYSEEAENARNEAWCAQLGDNEKSADKKEVENRIRKALKGEKDWILLGGPPCQAYSVVGRSRLKRKILNAEEDHRVELYKQYLRILAKFNPMIFVMENVKGILSSKTKDNNVFEKIQADLKDPVSAYRQENGSNGEVLECPGYDIYPLTVSLEGDYIPNPADFVIRCEEHGIPQARHRVIILGVRKNVKLKPKKLPACNSKVTVGQVIDGLPKLRSGISRGVHNRAENWLEILKRAPSLKFFKKIDSDVAAIIRKTLSELKSFKNDSGHKYIETDSITVDHPAKDWFLDKRIGGVVNHESRSHMQSDLYRYLFVSAFGKVYKKSPTLSDFPEDLLPAHKNINDGISEKKFADRFRVQIADAPSKTITSHISKDGHYYIHPDPSQCRSLTVREAARIQTFPDNYFFCGPRTSQYIQVGNAVPPLLAMKIGKTLSNVVLKGKKDAKINR